MPTMILGIFRRAGRVIALLKTPVDHYVKQAANDE